MIRTIAKTLGITLGAMVIAVAGGFIWLMNSVDKAGDRAQEAASETVPASDEDKNAAPDPALTARTACYLFIKPNLHDPGSADWTKWWGSPATKDQNGIWTVRGTLRAKNGFGAKSISRFHCEVVEMDGEMLLIDLREF